MSEGTACHSSSKLSQQHASWIQLKIKNYQLRISQPSRHHYFSTSLHCSFSDKRSFRGKSTNISSPVIFNF
jgi:hypothetical protein